MASGEFAVLKAIKEGKACVVLVTRDASERTKKKFRDKCTYYNVPCFERGTMDAVGHALGKETRVSVAVLDPGFANEIVKRLSREGNT
jgi:ribosomal protein L7Ae-like RNA K-turn-binding protein